MTTITIVIHERGTYLPPEAPSFGTAIARTFLASWDALVGFGKSLVLLGVAVAPWMIPLALLGVPARLIGRRRSQMGGKATPLVVPDQTGPPSG